MTHLTDDYENLQPPSQQPEAPQPLNGNPVSENTGVDEGVYVQPSPPVQSPPPAQSFPPANENVAPHVPANVQAFEDHAAESFSIAASDRLDDVQGMYAAGTETYETITQAVRASFEEIAAGLGQFNTKLMEFGRVNAQNNMAFMQSVAGVRSVRDVVDVQTAYMRGQYDAAANQLRELQTLTTEIAEKAAAPFKQQLTRSTQMFRSC